MEKLKGAIIGLGFISGKGHLPAYKERNDVEIVAVADICEGRRKIAREVLPKARIYANYKEMLENEAGPKASAEGRKLDFIDISTPPNVHAEIAIEAMKMGIHVLCEKPLATEIKDAEKMLLTAKNSKRVLFPCHNYKHAPVVKFINETIASGKIGEVKTVALSTYRTTHAKGVTEWDTDWRRRYDISGGGIAMDHGSHTFYLTFEWLKSLPTSITAKMLTLDKEWDTEDNLTCVLTYPTGYAHSFLTWTAGVRKVIYSIQGTKGAITVNDDEAEVCDKATHNITKHTIASDWMDASHTTWFNSMFDKFKKAIAENDYVNEEIKQSLMCVRIIKTSYECSRGNSNEIPIDNGFEFLKEIK